MQDAGGIAKVLGLPLTVMFTGDAGIEQELERLLAEAALSAP
jgi:hypothetical protein